MRCYVKMLNKIKKLLEEKGLLLLGALVFTLFLRTKFDAVFFDIFGVFIFAFLIGFSLWGLVTPKKTPEWVLLTILSIGLMGFLVDGFTVIKEYFIIYIG